MDGTHQITELTKDILHRLVWAAMIKNESIKNSHNLYGSLNRVILQRKMWFSLMEKIKERRIWSSIMKQIKEHKNN